MCSKLHKNKTYTNRTLEFTLLIHRINLLYLEKTLQFVVFDKNLFSEICISYTVSAQQRHITCVNRWHVHATSVKSLIELRKPPA